MVVFHGSSGSDKDGKSQRVKEGDGKSQQRESKVSWLQQLERMCSIPSDQEQKSDMT